MDSSDEPASEQPVGVARLRLCAALFSACGRLTVTVIDMSADGVAAMCDDPPPCDSFAILVRNGIKVPATVAWAEGGRIGLKFDTPLLDERRRAVFVGAPGRRPAALPRLPVTIVVPAALRVADCVARAA